MEKYNIPPCFYRLSAKALIHSEEGKFLLIKSPQSNRWDLPGGGIDFGETPEICLRREIREEMDLEIIYFDPKPCYFYSAKGLDKEFYVANIVYRVTLENLEFTPTDECEEIKFCSVSDASQLDIYPKTQEFLKHYNPANHVHL